MANQLTNRIIMIRPKSFGFNIETASSNKFQSQSETQSKEEITNLAIVEFDQMVQDLDNCGIDVQVFNDSENVVLPDSIFPNNWITLHQDGTIYTYPMFSEIRRKERREDIIDNLSKQFQVKRRYSLEMFEDQNQFLEGTGSMILDRENKIAYACLSPRTDPRVMDKFALLSNYQAFHFKATDLNGFEIYHTNVMMSIGKDFVICCLESVESQKREELLKLFEKTAKALIEINFTQMAQFAGNMLQVISKTGEPHLIMSQTAYNSLDQNQLKLLRDRTKLLVVKIPTIEKVGGGSARCMIAENFLPKK